jgi:GT2 family glycosyltransferase
VDFSIESPAMHYCRLGWLDGRDPAWWFSTREYVERYSHILGGQNPFLDYLERGQFEGRMAISGRLSTEPRPDIAKVRVRGFEPNIALCFGQEPGAPTYSAVGLRPERRVQSSQTERPNGISVIILTLDKPRFVIPLLRQLVTAQDELCRSEIPLEVLVGDTGSTDQSVLMAYDELAKHIRIVRGLTYNFSANNNDLFTESTYNRVLFCNNDVRFLDAVSALRIMATELDSAGIVGPQLFFPDGKLQHCGLELVLVGDNRTASAHYLGSQTALRRRPGFSIKVPAVTGAMLMIWAHLFANLDGFDRRYQEECQDVDLCLAAQRIGHDVRLVYSGDIIHFENGTRPAGSTHLRDRARLARKWASFTEVIGEAI